MTGIESVLLFSIGAAIAGWVGGSIFQHIAGRGGIIITHTISTLIAYQFFTTFNYIVIVALAPMWAMVAIALVFSLIKQPLVKRGYFGNQEKWHTEIEQDNRFLAAFMLLDDEQIQAAVEVSSDANDYYDNILKAAGLDEYEAPGLD